MSELLQSLRNAPPPEARARLARFVRERVAALLDLDPEHDVGPEDGFADLGFDSLRAVDFKLELETELGCELRTTLLFDFPTPAALTEHLALEALGLAPEAPPAAAGARTEPEADLGALSIEELRERVRRQEAVLRTWREPVAVIGMACRFPGGASDPDRYWRLLLDGVDAITEVPPGRWAIDDYYDPDREAPGKMFSRWGGFLEDVDRFDAAFFGISPREAVQLDPQQRLLLEVAWEAVERAGLAPSALAGTATGVFVGMRESEYFDSQSGRGPETVTSYYATGNALSTAAGRVAYFMGLTGPAIALDTACSSSLVAVHQACQSLRRGESDAALAGGVALILDPLSNVGICKASMAAADGRCKTFSAAADGYVRSEGCGLLLLKRLSDARRDGDRVLAVIRGSAVNQDGASGGLTVPNGPAQEAVIRAALRDAGVAPREVGYVEAHGTGTALGDPIEVGALDAVFGPDRPAGRPLLVGSVKTNVGHLEPAAGIAGLIKLIQALRHGTLPRLLHLDAPNPHVPWDRVAVAPVTETAPWPAGGLPRVGGVSSFGFSGTNCHVVVAEAPPAEEPPAEKPIGPEPARPAELLPLSAASPGALRELAARYRDLLAAPDAPALADVAGCAAEGRAHLAHRLAVVAADAPGAAAELARFAEAPEESPLPNGRAPAAPPELAFLFTGQGAQYAGMGRELYAHLPAFRDALDRCAEELAPHLAHPLLEVLWGEHAALLDETAFTQPALFALEVALAELWRSLGVVPARALGHSVGEYAAAHVAGVLSLADAARLIAARARLMVERTERGSMLAVLASAEEVRPLLEAHAERASLAAVNGPASAVVSGAAAAVEAVARECAARGLRTQPLAVSHAFHSPLMDPMLAEFGDVAGSLSYRAPELELVSCLDPGAPACAFTDPGYWVRHVREPVRFLDGVRVLGERGAGAFLELGPQPTLLGLARRCLPAAEGPWLPSLRRNQPELRTFLAAAAQLYVRGVPLRWDGLRAGRPRRFVPLPTYPFQRRRYWLERPAPGPRRSGGRAHELLGAPVRVSALEEGEQLYESWLGPGSPAFLADHRVFGRVVVPAAAFLECALAAGRAEHAVADFAIHAPLLLEGGPRPVQLHLTPGEGDGALDFRLASLENDGEDAEPTWTLHATGRLLPAEEPDAPEPLGDLRTRVVEAVDPAELYRGYAALGLDYGPSFRAVAALWRRDGESLARLALPAEAPGGTEYALHPVLLDACFQSVAAALSAEPPGAEAYLPLGVERLAPAPGAGTPAWCHAAARESSGGARTLDLALYDESGEPAGAVLGLQLVRADPTALLGGRDGIAELLHAVEWRPAPDPPPEGAEPVVTGRWVILADGGGLGAELAELLERRGEPVTRIEPEAAHARDPAALEARLGALEPPLRAVVHLGALDGGPPEELCATALHLAQALARLGPTPPPRLWLVTRGAQPAGPEPAPLALDQAPLWGLGATLALEHAEWRCTRLDLDPARPAGEVEALAAELARAAEDETQLALRGGALLAARLVRCGERTGAGVRLERPASGPFELRTPRYGALENLELVPRDEQPPGPGEVRVAIAASALNFKDVLHALGLLEEHSRRAGVLRATDQPFGFEGAGTVAALGPGVSGWSAGDPVLVSAAGCMASHVNVPAAALSPVPEGLAPEEAAALQTVFLTALYGLERLAGLSAGDRVLIHACAGGVGQAALQLAQRAGAEVFATASPGKWEHLRRQGVRFVFSSRSADFADEVLRLTEGAGVDVVLNSLTGEMIPASLRVLASDGRFVEIGKLGIWSPEDVAAERPDVEYHTFDLGEVLEADRALHQSLRADLLAGFRDGSLRALPTRAFPIEEAHAAFGFLARARNVGKVVLTLAAPEPMPEATTVEPPALPVRPDHSYLVTGGLGALGRAVGRALVEAGASHLVLAGRSEPDETARAAAAELAAGGAAVRLAAVDVADRAALAELMADFGRGAPPLAGVVHAAGVLDDGVLLSLDRGRLERVLAPKVAGARNLDELSRGHDLDFFVAFSSLAALLGSRGQASYAAANAYLDALAHHRRAEGLPGLSIGWGPWSGSGMAARLASRGQARFAEMGLAALAPERGLAVLERLLAADPDEHGAHVGVLPIRWKPFLRQFRSGDPPAFYAAFAAQHAPARSRDSALLQSLAAADGDERRRLLAAYLAEELARVLGSDTGGSLDLQHKFADMGVDSLLAVDLRGRLEGGLGCALPATLLFDYPTPAALVEHLAADVLAPAAAPAPATPEEPDALEELSEDQLADQLAEELDALSGSAARRRP